jgi:hypothetical protein
MPHPTERLIESCPNCKRPDPDIKPTAEGKCGACGGTGKIEWKDTGIRFVHPTEWKTKLHNEIHLLVARVQSEDSLGAQIQHGDDFVKRISEIVVEAERRGIERAIEMIKSLPTATRTECEDEAVICLSDIEALLSDLDK